MIINNISDNKGLTADSVLNTNHDHAANGVINQTTADLLQSRSDSDDAVQVSISQKAFDLKTRSISQDDDYATAKLKSINQSEKRITDQKELLAQKEKTLQDDNGKLNTNDKKELQEQIDQLKKETTTDADKVSEYSQLKADLGKAAVVDACNADDYAMRIVGVDRIIGMYKDFIQSHEDQKKDMAAESKQNQQQQSDDLAQQISESSRQITEQTSADTDTDSSAALNKLNSTSEIIADVTDKNSENKDSAAVIDAPVRISNDKNYTASDKCSGQYLKG